MDSDAFLRHMIKKHAVILSHLIGNYYIPSPCHQLITAPLTMPSTRNHTQIWNDHRSYIIVFLLNNNSNNLNMTERRRMYKTSQKYRLLLDIYTSSI